MMRFSWFSFLTVIVAVTGARKKGPCKAELFDYYNDHLGCHTCDTCPPGKAPIIDNKDIKWDQYKGALTCYRCGPCKPETYSENWDHNKCTGCLSCDLLSRHVVRNCSKGKDTQCGKCQPGFHDIYRAQRGYNDTRTHCQPCHMAKDLPECADLPTSYVPLNADPTIGLQSKLPTPTSAHKHQGPNGNVIKMVNPPQTSKTDYTVIYVLTGVGGMLLALGLGVFILRHRGRDHQTNSRSVGDVESSVYRPTTVTDYHILSSAASSANSLLGQTAPGPSFARRVQQAVSPRPVKVMHFKKEKLSEDVTEDSLQREHLMEERRKHKVNKNDFEIIKKDIGADWKNLARELHISDPQIEELQIDNKTCREQIHQMLLLFYRNESPPIVDTLCEALKAIHRKDIRDTLLKVSSTL